MVRASYLDQYFDVGARLTPLIGKAPRLPEWQDKKISETRLRRYKGNLGWIMGEGHLVVDVDPRNGGEASFEKLTSLIGEIEGSVKTPSGGVHIYFKLPEEWVGRKLKKNLQEYPGIDFITGNAYCVIAGSAIDGVKYEWVNGGIHIHEAPEDLLELLDKGVGDDFGDMDYLEHATRFQKDEAEVLALLDQLDPNMGYHEWKDVGMVLRTWAFVCGIGDDRAMEMWDDWSKGGETYQDGEPESKWRSFSKEPGPNSVGFGTIYHANDVSSQAVRVSSSMGVFEDFEARVKAADRSEIMSSLAIEIRGADLPDIQMEMLAQVIKLRMRDLGSPIGISDARALLRGFGGGGNTDRDQPQWTSNWVFVDKEGKYGSIRRRKLIAEKTFRHKFQQRAPMMEGGSRMNLIKWLEDNGWMKTVSGVQYLPQFGEEPLPYINGERFLNTFDPSSIPEAEPLTKKGKQLTKRIKEHMHMLVGDDAEIILQWMAHNVQNPGLKIRWAPLIQSIKGAGKGVIESVLIACLGDNVGTVASKTVSTDFNAWSSGRCVNVFQELKITGHNRFDVMNALKPLITDGKIEVHKKGVDPYTAMNVTNYICFTNYMDAIPIDDGERRYCIMFSPVTKETKKDAEYFTNLYGDIETYRGQVRTWLMDYDTQMIKEASEAPKTSSRAVMIRIEEGKTEGLTETRELIEKGGKGYDDQVIFTTELFRDLMDDMLFDDPVQLNRRQKGLIMNRLGYDPHPDRLNLNGSKQTVYTKGIWSNKAIRGYIKAKGW